MTLLDYVYNGFLPNSYEDEESFIQRSNITINLSNKLREQIKNKDNSLEKIFKGDVSKLKLNPYHYNACEQIYSLISIYPETFVGIFNNLTEVYPKTSNLKLRKRALGLCEYTFVDKYPVATYFLPPDEKMSMAVSRHELYHCIQRMPNIIKDIYSRDKRNNFTEELRAYLVANGLDCNLERDVENLKSIKADLIILTNHNSKEFDPNIDIQELRHDLYNQFKTLENLFIHPKKNVIADVGLGSFTSGLSAPFLLSNPIFAGIGLIYGAYKLGKGVLKTSNNIKIKSSNKIMREFMCDTREKLKDEFGIRGANFLAYTLLWDEIKPITKTKKSIKDWLHHENSFRTSLILDYTLSLD